MRCQKLPEDEWLGSRQLLLQVHSPVPLYLSRAYGENIGLPQRWQGQPGSSPHVRGKRARLRRHPGHPGLIPAHTGKTVIRVLTLSPTRAHPRTYGERASLKSVCDSQRGSSPRIRGKPGHDVANHLPGGLTPAHAGKTHWWKWSRPMGWAHPRAYGENHLEEAAEPFVKGSSPRIRGKLMAVMIATGSIGLIPAHTGKTRRSSQAKAGARAHPRAYGENTSLQSSQGGSTGSSPRIRGKHGTNLTSRAYLGLIPAHTGKTTPFKVPFRNRRAHPRAYGENGCGECHEAALVGSSPRIRGKQLLTLVTGVRRGLIPAHTGKTQRT